MESFPKKAEEKEGQNEFVSFEKLKNMGMSVALAFNLGACSATHEQNFDINSSLETINEQPSYASPESLGRQYNGRVNNASLEEAFVLVKHNGRYTEFSQSRTSYDNKTNVSITAPASDLISQVFEGKQNEVVFVHTHPPQVVYEVVNKEFGGILDMELPEIQEKFAHAPPSTTDIAAFCKFQQYYDTNDAEHVSVVLDGAGHWAMTSFDEELNKKCIDIVAKKRGDASVAWLDQDDVDTWNRLSPLQDDVFTGNQTEREESTKKMQELLATEYGITLTRTLY